MNAIWRFVEGYRRGVRRQQEIGSSKQKSSVGSSPPTDKSHVHDYEHWSTVRTLLEQLGSEADRLEIYGDRLQEYIAQGTIDEGEWQAIESRLSREWDDRDFFERKRKFQATIREKLLSNFVQEHVSTEFDFQKQSLKHRIEILLWEGKEEALQTYLVDVLQLGLEKANKNEEQERRKGGYAGYVWHVLIGIYQVGIVLGAFSVSKTRFETVVIALIVLTYQLIEDSSRAVAISMLGYASGSWEQSRHIRRLLKEEMPEEIRDRDEADRRQVEKVSYFTMVGSRIHDTFALMVWVITIFELVFKGIF